MRRRIRNALLSAALWAVLAPLGGPLHAESAEDATPGPSPAPSVEVDASVSAASQRIDASGNRFKLFQYRVLPRGAYSPEATLRLEAPDQMLRLELRDLAEPDGRGRLRYFHRDAVDLRLERTDNAFFLYPSVLDRTTATDARDEWRLRLATRLGDLTPRVTWRRVGEHVERPAPTGAEFVLGAPVGPAGFRYASQDVTVAVPFRLGDARLEGGAGWTDFDDQLPGSTGSRPVLGDQRTSLLYLRGTWEIGPQTSLGWYLANQQLRRDLLGVDLNRNLVRLDLLQRLAPGLRVRALLESERNDNDFTRTAHYKSFERARVDLDWQATRELRLSGGAERDRVVQFRPTAQGLRKYPLLGADGTSPPLVPIAPGDLVSDRVFVNRLWLAARYRPTRRLTLEYRLRESRMPRGPFTEILVSQGLPPTGVVLGLYPDRILTQSASVDYAADPALHFVGTWRSEFRRNAARSVFLENRLLSLGVDHQLTSRFSWHFAYLFSSFDSASFPQVAERGAVSSGFEGGIDYRILDNLGLTYGISYVNTGFQRDGDAGFSPSLERSQRVALRYEPLRGEVVDVWYERRNFDERLSNLLNFKSSAFGAGWTHRF